MSPVHFGGGAAGKAQELSPPLRGLFHLCSATPSRAQATPNRCSRSTSGPLLPAPFVSKLIASSDFHSPPFARSAGFLIWESRMSASTPTPMGATPIPAQGIAAVTAADSDLPQKPCRALWVGGAGNLSLTMADGSTATISSVPAGTLLPLACVRVNAATTATLIVALY